MFSLTRRSSLLREGAWVAMGQAATILGLFLGIRLLSELIAPGVLGSVSLVVGIVNLTMGTVCAPAILAVLRFYPEAAANQNVHQLRTVVARSLLRQMICLACLFLLIGSVYCLWVGASWLAVVAATAFLCAQAKLKMENFFLTAARRQRAFSISTCIEAVSQPYAACLVILLLGASPQAVLVGYAVAEGIALLIVLAFVKREGLEPTPHVPTMPDLGASLRKYALPMIPLAGLGWIAVTSDRYLVGALVSLEMAGVYIAAYGFVDRAFNVVSQIFAVSIRPRLFEAVSRNDARTERKLIGAWLGGVLAVSLLGVLAVLLARHLIVRILFAQSYAGAAEFMPLIALGYVGLNLAMAIEGVCQAHKRTELTTLIRASGAAACLAIGIPMIYFFGAWGAAASVPLYFGLQGAVAIGLLWRVVYKRPVLTDQSLGKNSDREGDMPAKAIPWTVRAISFAANSDMLRNLLRVCGLKSLAREFVERTVFRRLLRAGKMTADLSGHPVVFAVSTATEVERLVRNQEDRFTDRILDTLQSGDVVYDVGANIGLISLAVAARDDDCEVHAFEPETRNADRLEENVRLNSMNVHVHRVALADQTEQGQLFVSGELGTGTHSIVDRRAELSSQPQATQFFTMDEFSREMAPPPDVVKIDVEGGEYKVFLGMQRLLEGQRIRDVFVEMHPAQLQQQGQSEESCLRRLEEIGYVPCWSEHRGGQNHYHLVRRQEAASRAA